VAMMNPEISSTNLRRSFGTRCRVPKAVRLD
jgi:hypothetical protein